MNTTPLAPRSPVVKRRTFRSPVTRAVTAAMKSRLVDPYFSSSMGPTSRMMAKLLMKWFQSA